MLDVYTLLKADFDRWYFFQKFFAHILFFKTIFQIKINLFHEVSRIELGTLKRTVYQAAG